MSERTYNIIAIGCLVAWLISLLYFQAITAFIIFIAIERSAKCERNRQVFKEIAEEMENMKKIMNSIPSPEQQAKAIRDIAEKTFK